MKQTQKQTAGKGLALVWLVALAAGVLIGVPSRYTHHTIYGPARALLALSGAAMIAHAALLAGGGRRERVVARWMALAGLGLIGIGIHALVRGPWTLLAVPVCAAGAVVQVRALWRGPRDPWFAMLLRSMRLRSRKDRSVAAWLRRTRIYLAGIAVLLAAGVAMAIGAAG